MSTPFNPFHVFDSRPRHKRDGFRRPSCAIAPLPNPCLKTELLPETMQEGHGRHSLCNSFRSFPPNTFGEDATSETRRRQRGPDTRRRRGGSNEGIPL